MDFNLLSGLTWNCYYFIYSFSKLVKQRKLQFFFLQQEESSRLETSDIEVDSDDDDRTDDRNDDKNDVKNEMKGEDLDDDDDEDIEEDEDEHAR